MENQYKHVVYKVGKIYVPEGFYTEKELEELLANMKRRGLALKKAMRRI